MSGPEWGPWEVVRVGSVWRVRRRRSDGKQECLEQSNGRIQGYPSDRKESAERRAKDLNRVQAGVRQLEATRRALAGMLRKAAQTTDEIIDGLLSDCEAELRRIAASLRRSMVAALSEGDLSALADRCAAARRLLIETHEGNVTHATTAAARGVLP